MSLTVGMKKKEVDNGSWRYSKNISLGGNWKALLVSFGTARGSGVIMGLESIACKLCSTLVV